MAGDLETELRAFLTDSNLSTYCINAYLALMDSADLTARELTKKSGVPIGRIYEVLDELETKGLVKIHGSRPKKYQALPLNRALYNLVTYQTKEDKRKAKYLFERAKSIEHNWHVSKPQVMVDPSKIFYSTILGSKEIFSLYSQCFEELEDELLVNEFVNQSTLQVLSLAEDFFTGVCKALDRGVQVKMLLSCEHDDRPLSKEDELKYSNLISQIKDKHEEYGLSTGKAGFEMKYFPKRMPFYYDIFDRKRVIFKLQNPSSPWQVFASLNIVDPVLAEELRKMFHNIWIYEALEV